ncbi:hypothetical protein GV829_04670 [Sphingomonas lacunae]|uniref:Uncharacterized protein n=1 Tax=Sphingomonas lacunae TaxID=2698828 RepID=A0A6M4AUT5_9SPHN|nr:hypothetical protein [Sphingomonas lacunae]QJQ31829.1 hypothetical protein GV829_04670 [Sphingomonas lacunae]
MSLDVCIPDLVAKGQLTQEQADELTGLYGELKRNYRRQFGDQTAAGMATQETLRAMEQAAALKKRRTLLQVQAQRQAWLNMQSYGTGAGGLRVLDPDRPGHMGEAADALLARREYAPYANVEYQAVAIKGQAHATLAGFLARHRRDIIGRVQDKAGLDDIVRALFGETVENANARELADAVRETFEMLRLRRNAAGGNTGKLDNYGLPQSHDSQAISDAGYAVWRDEIWPRLDRQRMIDERTNAPFSDEALELALRDVYETISSDGISKMTPGAFTRGSLAGQRDHSRFLHFKSADDWMAYANRFGGKGSPFDTIMGHIEHMSREIAAMEMLGPNPAQTVRWLGDMLQKDAIAKGGSKARREAARRAGDRVQRFYDEFIGTNRRPDSETLALGFGALRAWQVATKLGSAVLSTTSDQATQILARRFNGLPVARMIRTQAGLLNPASDADRQFAVRAMLTWEGAAQIAAAQARMTGEEITGDIARRTAEGVLRASGLNAMTDGGRWAFGMDFLSTITGNRHLRFAELDPDFRGSFERHGLTASQWDALRATPIENHKGAEWILPGNIGDQKVRDAVLRMIMAETDMAVPVATLRTRAAFNSTLQRGTWVGEAGRTMLQFKAFPITLMWQQIGRIMAQQGFSRATYAANMMILTTLAGAAAIQLKEVSKGRDPREVYDPDDPQATASFWAAASLQGGGWGIVGDFLKSSTNRFGFDVMTTVAGPSAQTINNVGNLLLTQPVKYLMDDVPGDGSGDANPGRAAVRILKSETPGGSLWYARLAFERIILDNLSRWADPNHEDGFRRLGQQAEDMGTEYFWAPGAGINEARAPDVTGIVASEEP